MYANRETVSITTGASSGAGTGYTGVVNGRILSIQYVKTDFTDGSTMTVTGEETGTAIWSETGVNASTVRAPRMATHSTAGAAALYAAGGTAINDYITIANERVKIEVTSAGNSKTGTYYVLWG